MRRRGTSELRSTRLVFISLCCFLMAQVYTLPIVVFGPWALWPTLPDIAFLGLVAAWIISPSSTEPIPDYARKILIAFATLTFVVCLSYVIFTLLGFNLDSLAFASNKGVGFGFYESLRMVQVLVLVRIVISIPFSPKRTATLRRVVTAAAWVVSLSVIATYFEIIDTSQLAPHIPNDKDVAGAWWHYVNNFNHYGLGAISYTHANVAAHTLLLVGFAVHLAGESRWKSSMPLLFTGLVATLLTGSRAGFVAMALLVGVYMLRRSPRWIFNVSLAGVATALLTLLVVSAMPPVYGDSQNGFLAILDRQAAIFQPLESGNLVGRNEIWAGRIDALNDDPIRWLIGWGFGSSPDTGPGLSPHMMVLQIIVELGIWVLVAVCVWLAWLLAHLWRVGGRDKVMFWTTVALLLSSATQETFYPVPSTGGFLAVFMVSVLVGLRTDFRITVSPSRADRRVPHAFTRNPGSHAMPLRPTGEIGTVSGLRR